ncbi:MAG: hypothetical protein WC521_06200 [Bdellovibrionales bacterium]
MAISALKDLKRLVHKLEDGGAFLDFFKQLKRERSDRAIILMCSSFVDCSLKASIATKIPNKDMALSLFEDGGPLQNLAAKIKMAETMNLFGPATRQNLDIIRTIRNAFAHSLSVKSFKTPEVAKACKALILPFGDKRHPFFGNGKIKFKTPRQKFVSITILISGHVMLGGMEFEDDDGVSKPIPKLP